MKRFIAIFAIVLCVAGAFRLTRLRAATPSPDVKWWYCLSVAEDECAPPRQYFGSSPLAPEALMERVVNHDQIVLADLRVVEPSNDRPRVQPWSSRNLLTRDEIRFNPHRVVAVQALVGDPLKSMENH